MEKRKKVTNKEATIYIEDMANALQIFPDSKQGQAVLMAIKALEKDTVPFDFELYEAGLMDMPKGMIEVLDKIRAEIEALPKTYPFVNHFDMYVKEDDVKEIIDKYRVEKE